MKVLRYWDLMNIMYMAKPIRPYSTLDNREQKGF